MDKERRKLVVKGLGGVSAIALLSATSSEWVKPVVNTLVSSAEAQMTTTTTFPPTTLPPTAVPATTPVTLLALLSGLLWFGKKFRSK